MILKSQCQFCVNKRFVVPSSSLYLAVGAKTTMLVNKHARASISKSKQSQRKNQFHLEFY